MKIVVCVKQVPDTAAKVAVDNGKVGWGDAPLVINPWDEYAVEAALQMKESQGGTVTAVTIGGPSTADALKHALAMGCDDAILINDPALEVLDTQSAARVLAALPVAPVDAVEELPPRVEQVEVRVHAHEEIEGIAAGDEAPPPPTPAPSIRPPHARIPADAPSRASAP